MMPDAPHISVMLEDVLAALAPRDGEVYVDGTFGAGGYTRAFLESADCGVLAIDRDQASLARAASLKAQYGDRLALIYGCFGDADVLARENGHKDVDGFVIDIGVSSMQIDEPERGFSFRFDGPLDMRMDQGGGGETAADVVNTYDEKELADLIYQYGDERKSRQIARAIVRARAEKPFERTSELADLIRSVVPRNPRDKSDPATRSFQALRIHVNREIEELEKALVAAEKILKSGGRLIVVSFHSLEDGVVKRFLQSRSGQQDRGSRYLPEKASSLPPTFMLPSKKAQFPSEAEIIANPRSRSARMRVALRTDALSWPDEKVVKEAR